MYAPIASTVGLGLLFASKISWAKVSAVSPTKPDLLVLRLARLVFKQKRDNTSYKLFLSYIYTLSYVWLSQPFKL